MATARSPSLGAHALAQMARTLLESGALELARQTAHRALEEAAGDVGSAMANEASANQKGVSLARNVLANAADEIAQQAWAVTMALNEAFERCVASVIASAEAVKSAAMDAAGAVDAQLGDAELLSRASDEAVGKLEAKRAQATALLEKATDLVKALRHEVCEQRAGLQAAEKAVDDAEMAHERQQASDTVRALNMQLEALRHANDRLANEHARLESERDEAFTQRDEVLSAATLAAEQRAPEVAAAAELSAPASSLDQRAPYDRLMDRLKEGHWAKVRQRGGHPVYKRTVIFITLEGETETKEQTFSHPATPSDWRSILNSLSDLRAQDSGVIEALPSADAAAQAAALHELNQKRKQLSGELSSVEEEICLIESAMESEWDAERG